MELESVRRYLEQGGDENENNSRGMPLRFFERFVMEGLHVDLIEPGRLICSMKVPSRLVSPGNFFHRGASAMLLGLVGSAVTLTVGVPTTGVTVEVNFSYLDAAYAGEEIEIEAKVVRVGKAVGVVSFELRDKKAGKIIAQGRETKYLPATSKL